MSEHLFITLKIFATFIFVGFWLWLLLRLIVRGREAYQRTAHLPLQSDDAPPLEPRSTRASSPRETNAHG